MTSWGQFLYTLLKEYQVHLMELTIIIVQFSLFLSLLLLFFATIQCKHMTHQLTALVLDKFQ